MRPGTTVFEANDLYADAIEAIKQGKFLDGAGMLYDASRNGSRLATQLFNQLDISEFDMPRAGCLSCDETNKEQKFQRGLCYFFGIGVVQSDEEATRYFEELSSDFPAAKHMLALMYKKGRASVGLPKQEQVGKAIELYNENSAYGPSAYNLARMYDNGIAGPEMDKFTRYKRVSPLYKEAADQGFPAARYILGVLYANGVAHIDHAGTSGISLTVDEQNIEAVKWFRASADQGYYLAQYQLARKYEINTAGQEMTTEHRNSEIDRLYQSSADQGYAPALYQLACRYKKGWTGAELTSDERLAVAVENFQTAANQGYADAAWNAALIHGVKPVALKWFVYSAFLYAQQNKGSDLGDVVSRIDSLEEKTPQQQYALASGQSLQSDNPSLRLDALAKLEKFSDYQVFLEKDIECFGQNERYIDALMERIAAWPLEEEGLDQRLELTTTLLQLTESTIDGFINDTEFDPELLSKIIQGVKASLHAISPAEMVRSSKELGDPLSAIVMQLSTLALVQENQEEKVALCQHILSILEGVPTGSGLYGNPGIKCQVMQMFVAIFSDSQLSAKDADFGSMDVDLFKAAISTARSVINTPKHYAMVIDTIKVFGFPLNKAIPMSSLPVSVVSSESSFFSNVSVQSDKASAGDVEEKQEPGAGVPVSTESGEALGVRAGT
ncbi:MAG: tetratricopeptide repeat protein [Coxiellaceae bacterium]|nr:tetratricopeptide repeat protein [Coxiellaceae bacterium]